MESGGTCPASSCLKFKQPLVGQHFISLVLASAELVNFGADHRFNLQRNCPQVRHKFFCDFPADFQSASSFVWENRNLFAFRCILNASVMNGVTQTQIQRPKLPAGPAPVNAPPAPPTAQKPTPGHPHPGNPPTRPNQHTNAQPPPNRGQPPANAQHPKNKKKTEPAPVDPAVMYESLKNRIAALEEEETHEEEEERRFGTFLTTSTLFDV